jgi:hypothetical protein
MSDHRGGPRSIATPEIDITDVYAFPSPEHPGALVVVMDVFPFAAPSALFSDAIDYRIRLRPLRIESAGIRAAFAVGEPERVFSFTFDVPEPAGASGQVGQSGRCVAPSGEIEFRVGDEAGAQSHGIRVFGGCRCDPFFLNLEFMKELTQTGRIPHNPAALNSLAGQNVLSIVVEVEQPSLMWGTDAGPLVAVLAETTTTGSIRARLDRVGRPEIKNFCMMDNEFDTVNRDVDVRDLYSEEDGFNLRPNYLGAYRARLNANLARYDRLDGKTDWPLDDHGNHPLTELLLADFLVVDIARPFNADGYFEIEGALLSGAEHQTCGGRWLDHDMADTWLTVLVNNGTGARIRDGVDRPFASASLTFPYMPAPTLNPPPPPKLGAIVA